MAITLSFLNRFSKFFHCWKDTWISNKTMQHFPPYLQYVAALPCENYKYEIVVIYRKRCKNCVTFDKNRNVFCYMAEYCHNSCSKCPSFACTHARRRPRHSPIALSMMVWSMPCETCKKRCFSSQHFLNKIVCYLQRIFNGNRKLTQQVSK